MGTKDAETESSAITPYGTFDLSVMEEAAKDLPSGGGNFYKATDGKNAVRFIPPLRGKPALKIFSKHWFEAGGDRKAIVCTKESYNQPCPLCQQRAKLQASGNAADQKRAKAYTPRSSVYVNVVDMKHPEKGVQTYAMPPTLFKNIMAVFDNQGCGKSFADPVKGRTVVFTRKGSGRDTEYDGIVCRDVEPLPDADALIRGQPDLEMVEQPPTDEEQEAAVDGEFKVEAREKKGGAGKKAGGFKRGTEDADTDADVDF